MKFKKIVIKTDQELFFKQYVNLIKPFLNLRNRDCDILAELMYLSFLKRNIDITDRFKIILSTKSRKEICEKLDISSDVLRNSLSLFRKKNILNEDIINPRILVEPGSEFHLIYLFQIEDNDKGS